MLFIIPLFWIIKLILRVYSFTYKKISVGIITSKRDSQLLWTSWQPVWWFFAKLREERNWRRESKYFTGKIFLVIKLSSFTWWRSSVRFNQFRGMVIIASVFFLTMKKPVSIKRGGGGQKFIASAAIFQGLKSKSWHFLPKNFFLFPKLRHGVISLEKC